MLNELHSTRKYRHPKIVLCYALACCVRDLVFARSLSGHCGSPMTLQGWFAGYVITSGILFGVWWTGSEFSGSTKGSLGAGLLIVRLALLVNQAPWLTTFAAQGQLIVALVNSAALILYLVRYAIPVYHLEPHGEDASQMKTPLRRASDKAKRSLSRHRSRTSRDQKPLRASSKRSTSSRGSAKTSNGRSADLYPSDDTEDGQESKSAATTARPDADNYDDSSLSDRSLSSPPPLPPKRKPSTAKNVSKSAQAPPRLSGDVTTTTASDSDRLTPPLPLRRASSRTSQSSRVSTAHAGPRTRDEYRTAAQKTGVPSALVPGDPEAASVSPSTWTEGDELFIPVKHTRNGHVVEERTFDAVRNDYTRDARSSLPSQTKAPKGGYRAYSPPICDRSSSSSGGAGFPRQPPPQQASYPLGPPSQARSASAFPSNRQQNQPFYSSSLSPYPPASLPHPDGPEVTPHPGYPRTTRPMSPTYRYPTAAYPSNSPPPPHSGDPYNPSATQYTRRSSLDRTPAVRSRDTPPAPPRAIRASTEANVQPYETQGRHYRVVDPALNAGGAQNSEDDLPAMPEYHRP